jgi:hypothetical protein
MRLAGYFTDNSSTFDYIGKNSYKFIQCDIDNPWNMGNIVGDRVTFTQSTFNGRAGAFTTRTAQANELSITLI